MLEKEETDISFPHTKVYSKRFIGQLVHSWYPCIIFITNVKHSHKKQLS